MPKTKGRYRTGQPDLLDYVKRLEDRVSALERTPQLPTSSVNRGGTIFEGGVIVVKRPDNSIYEQGAITMGSNVTINGEAGMQLNVRRSTAVRGLFNAGGGMSLDGNSALQVFTVDGSSADPTFGTSTVRLQDKSGDTLFADSLNARIGMSQPQLHQSFNSGTYASSTSTSFASIMTTEWYMYHPHLRVRVLVQNDASNSSELRVNEAGGSYTQTVSVGLGAFQYIDVIIPRKSTTNGLSSNGNVAILTLEHRRVAGAGTIRTQIISVVGIDLSYFSDY